jgi:MFS transporter, DHA1 family, staphyloferrin A biosynthesis exporter
LIMSIIPSSEDKRRNIVARTFTSISVYKNFRLFWGGSVLEHMGEWMEITALLWLINEMTHSPFIGTLMVTLRLLPMVVFAFVGGIVADRINRRNLLIYALLASALFSVAMAILVHTSYIEPWHILVYSAVTGIVTSFNHPARNTLLPNLVDRKHLLNAITLDNGSIMVSRVLGAPIAGVMIGLFGAMPVLGVRALGAFLAVLMLTRISAPSTIVKVMNTTPVKDFIEGIRYAGEHRAALTQVLLYLIPVFITNTYTGLLPYLATDILHIGPDLYGVMNAIPGTGSIVATLVLASLVNVHRKAFTLLLSGIIQGIGLIFFGFLPIYELSLILLFILGGAGTLFMILNNSIIQEMLPDQVRGRVMSFREVAFGLGPSGSLLSGVIAGMLGVSIALGLAGCASIALMLAIVCLIPRK